MNPTFIPGFVPVLLEAALRALLAVQMCCLKWF